MVEQPDAVDSLQHRLEQSRLDEILTMCAEYDSQMACPPPLTARPPDSPAVAHRRYEHGLDA